MMLGQAAAVGDHVVAPWCRPTAGRFCRTTGTLAGRCSSKRAGRRREHREDQRASSGAHLADLADVVQQVTPAERLLHGLLRRGRPTIQNIDQSHFDLAPRRFACAQADEPALVTGRKRADRHDLAVGRPPGNVTRSRPCSSHSTAARAGSSRRRSPSPSGRSSSPAVRSQRPGEKSLWKASSRRDRLRPVRRFRCCACRQRTPSAPAFAQVPLQMHQRAVQAALASSSSCFLVRSAAPGRRPTAGRHPEGGEGGGDRDRGAAAREAVDRADDRPLRLRVDAGGRLVENENRRSNNSARAIDNRCRSRPTARPALAELAFVGQGQCGG